ncbi:MAG: hypothetical protein CVU84_09800 [Firmicutes bacterium HGW-Firmicutes-1]|jgi:diguanylate cyclase (GGDEF)-like protein|nr:MAG: hypothetical protein CVU84_09800 [Firmicutes bacterium HGW-Firmicutes-1]
MQVKEIKKLFYTNDVKEDQYRAYTIIFMASALGLLLHLSFAIIFHLLDIHILARINYVSIFIYSFCVFINRKAYHNLALLTALFEVVVHSVIATLLLGWSVGFHYYILCIGSLSFYATTIKIHLKIAVSVFLLITYILLSYLTDGIAGPYTLNVTHSALFNYFNIICSFSVFTFMAYLYSHSVGKVEYALRKENVVLGVDANTDVLTGILNRRYIMKVIEERIRDYQKNNESFVLVMSDIDDFKSLNDKYGHECGDIVLSAVAAFFLKNLRKDDLISRWGGEEFLILLPKTTISEGEAVVEKIRERLSNHTILYQREEIRITMTFGICEFYENMSFSDLINIADQRLYKGKNQGKNCVVS